MSFGESIILYKESLLYISLTFLWCVFLFSIYNKKRISGNFYRYNKFSLIKSAGWKLFAILPIVTMAGIRGYNTGADTSGVWEEYLKCSDMTFSQVATYDLTAVLYYFYSWIIAKITNANPQIFMASLTMITMLIIMRAIDKWNLKYGGLSMYIFLACLGPNLLNQSRQILAVSVLFYGYYYAYNCDDRKYWAIILVSSLIHLASFPAGIAIWFINRNRSAVHHKVIFWSIYLISIFGTRYITTTLITLLSFQKFKRYIDTITNERIGLGLLLVCLPTVVLALLMNRYMHGKDRKMRDTILLTLPARLMGYTVYFAYRVYYYFSVQNVIAFPRQLEKMSRNNKLVYRLLIVLFCLVWFFVYYGWLQADTYFPYQTFTECGLYGIPGRIQ